MLVPQPETLDVYDLLVVALGYEPRSSSLAQKISSSAPDKIAFSFETEGLLAFDSNRAILAELGFDERPLADLCGFVGRYIRDWSDSSPPRIAVDISSFTRAVLADSLVTLHELSSGFRFGVDFYYSPPLFDQHTDPSAVIEHAGLLGPRFSGITSDPFDPMVCILGVGYEPELALGVTEFLDVSYVYAFVPSGHDERYDQAVVEANKELFSASGGVKRSPYDLRDPYGLYTRLESLMYGLGGVARIALVPLGPKIFSLCSLLAALETGLPVAAWRFSAGSGAQAPTETVGEPVRFCVRASGQPV